MPVLGCWPTEKLVKIMISAAADTASPWLSLRHSRRGHRTPTTKEQFTQKIYWFTIERIGNHKVSFEMSRNIIGFLPCNNQSFDALKPKSAAWKSSIQASWLAGKSPN